jgi:hypothetical protein
MAILWIVDRDGPRLEAGIRMLPNEDAHNLIVNVRRNTALSDLVAEVRGRVRVPVNLVRIVSHGNSGRLLFSNGTVDIGRVGAFGFLRGLITQPVFVGSAGIEIHGCGVASDYLPPPRVEQGIGNVTIANYDNMQGELSSWGNSASGITTSRGVLFLRAFANVCGVGVMGGIDYQLPDASWSYEGPTITVSASPSRQARLSDPRNRFGLGEFYNFYIN